MEKLVHMVLEVPQPMVKTNPNFQRANKPWIVTAGITSYSLSSINLVLKNKDSVHAGVCNLKEVGYIWIKLRPRDSESTNGTV